MISDQVGVPGRPCDKQCVILCLLDGNNSVKLCILHWHYSYVEVEMPRAMRIVGEICVTLRGFPFSHVRAGCDGGGAGWAGAGSGLSLVGPSADLSIWSSCLPWALSAGGWVPS